MSLFNPNEAPANYVTEIEDSIDYEMGMRFQASAAGSVTGLKYYRRPDDNVDAHIIRLWNAAGTKLTEVLVESDMSATGWQTGTLVSPVSLVVDEIYTVSYSTYGGYSYTSNYFDIPKVSSDGILTAPSDTNGVFWDYAVDTFPTKTFNGTNYWVDVEFLRA